MRAGESINDFETVRRRKDGTLVAVSIAAAPVRDGSGRVVGNMVAYTDITERKAQEERLQALIDSSPLALVEFGLDTRIRLWNPAAERIFGWTREEMLGRGGLPMAPPDKRAESEDLFARVLAGESVNDYETVRLRKDGTLVAVSIAAAPVSDGSGRVVGNMVAYTDITERKAQEAEVHRLNAELHARLEELAASRARIVDRRRRRAAPARAQPPRRRAAAPGRARAVAAARAGEARLRPGGRARGARRAPATSSPSRSPSCASSPAASIRRCSPIAGCAPPSRCSRAARPSRSRSRRSPTSGCRSPSRRRRTT